jgi:hypothetical protein
MPAAIKVTTGIKMVCFILTAILAKFAEERKSRQGRGLRFLVVRGIQAG